MNYLTSIPSLLITDQHNYYKNQTAQYKIYIQGPLIIECTFLNDQEIISFNRSCHSIEVHAGEELLIELDDLCNSLSDCAFKTNKFLEKFSAQEFLYSSLFSYFRDYVRKKHIFILWIKQFLFFFKANINTINTYLSEDYSILQRSDLDPFIGNNTSINIQFSAPPKSFLKDKYWLKNILYLWHKLTHPIPQNPYSLRLLIVIYKLPHHLDVFKSFFNSIKNKNLGVDIVLLDFEEQLNLTNHLSLISQNPQIRVFDFKDFKAPISINHADLYDLLEKKYENGLFFRKKGLLEYQELEYAWMNRIFSQLNPSVCIQMTSHEIGRVMTNVARHYQVPSVQLDYALYSDQFALQSKIKYTVRASISQAVIDLWKKRKDPSLYHISIGFCKLDSMPDIDDLHAKKEEFFNNMGLNFEQKTIFFASTSLDEGAIYGMEKEEIMEALCIMCHQNQWNLIIKKHPLEIDQSAKDIVKKHHFPFQLVFEHAEISLQECIAWGDIVTTQGSSIVLESTYYEKLFCFLSTSSNASPILAGADPQTNPLFTSMSDFEIFLKKYFTDPYTQQHYQKLLLNKKEYLLYKTDHLASERLLNLLTELSEKKLNGKPLTQI